MPKPTFRIAASNPAGRATVPQVNFLQILFNDCGYDRAQRNGWIEKRLGRWVKFLDELSMQEASRFIEELKMEKESR